MSIDDTGTMCVCGGEAGTECSHVLTSFIARLYLHSSRVLASRVQLPLMLAWAISIHKVGTAHCAVNLSKIYDVGIICYSPIAVDMAI